MSDLVVVIVAPGGIIVASAEGGVVAGAQMSVLAHYAHQFVRRTDEEGRTLTGTRSVMCRLRVCLHCISAIYNFN